MHIKIELRKTLFHDDSLSVVKNDSITKFSWVVKIRSIQEEESPAVDDVP